MTTIEITDIADVQDGDIVTLRWKEEPGITVTLEGPAQDSTVGDFRITRGRFVSATREVPDYRPGRVYTIQKRGRGKERAWCYQNTPHEVAFVDGEGSCWDASELADIKPVPDDAETLRRDVVKYKEAARKYQREHDKECAEVERLRAARQVPTREQIAKVLFRTTTGTASEANAGADAVLNLIEQGGAS